MRLLFASDFAGDSVGALGTSDTSLNNHFVAARHDPAFVFAANGIAFSGTLVQAAGLRGGTGKCWVKPPTIVVGYNSVSTDYPESITCSCFSFDFKFGTSVASQNILTIGKSSTALLLNTTAAGKLRATVNGVPHDSVALTIVVGQVYNCEILVKTGASSAGKFQVRIDGLIVPELQSAGITIVCGTPNVIANNSFDNGVVDNLHVGAFIWRGGDDAFSESLFIGGGDEGKIGRVQDLAVVGDGAYTGWRRVSGSFGGSSTPPYVGPVDTTFANDWEQLKETTFDGFLHYLLLDASAGVTGSEPIPQSWLHAPFDLFAAGTTPTIIGVFQSMYGAGGGGDVLQPFIRINRTDYIEAKFQNIAVAPPSGNLNQWPLGANANSQFGGCAIAYDLNQETLLPWTVADLQALEGGLRVVRFDTGKHQADRQKIVGQSLMTVVWVEGDALGGESADELGSECQPCNEASAARYYDSWLSLDGENADATKTMTLALAPGADWTTPGLTHTLTSSGAGSFLATDDDAPKKAFRLGSLDGDYVILDVVTYSSATSITVTNRTAVPTSLQAVATATWARMVSTVSGLGHLQGEEVYGNLDGVHYGPWTVAGGAVSFTDENDATLHAAVATVGLLITSEIETLDFDIPGQGRSVAATQKLVTQAFVQADKSRGLLFVADDDTTTEASFLTAAERAATPHILVSRKETFDIPTQWGKPGRVKIRHVEGVPLNILSIEPRIDAAGKQVG